MTKENFCGACIGIPLALAGGIGTGVSSNGYRQKNMYLGVSIGFILLGLLMVWYFKYYKKCSACIA